MIHVFGDSVTYGSIFKKKGLDREQRIWPHYVSKALNLPYISYAIPGASNWRIARQLQSLPLTEEDIVIIAWAEPSRFEFGVNPEHISPPFEHNHHADVSETEGNIIYRRFFNQLTERTADGVVREFNSIAYNELFNSRWFEQMFKVMYSSCCHKLNTSKCKWVMLNTWCRQYEDEDDIFNTPKYFIKGDDTLAKQIRQNNSIEYLNEEEHRLASEIILANLKQLYGNILGN